MDARFDPPAAGGTSRKNLVLKGLLLLLALVLPGGSLILLGMATWRGVKAARKPGESAFSLFAVRHAAFAAWRGLRHRRTPLRPAAQHHGSLAA